MRNASTAPKRLSTFSPSWSAAETLHGEVQRLSRDGRWKWIVTFHPKMPRETVEKFKALQGPHLRYAEDLPVAKVADATARISKCTLHAAREVARYFPDFEGLGHLVAFVLSKRR